MTKREFKKGDEVAWDHSQGTAHGEVVDKKTSGGKVKGFHYTASEADPKYIVKSDKTGARAAHSKDELRRE
ncbi:MAG TPA: DUF2945 domain-containing protein [Candidatus Thermoplasmatota archaeon]|nr:DUF2945 domain-containing protein [Candidatus Thermoplasmatota archaeon]